VFAAKPGKGKGKDKGNRRVVAPFGLHSSLRQNGSRCRGGVLMPGLKRVMKKVGAAKEDVPQRLKPQGKQDSYGTAEAVPLSKTRLFQHPLGARAYLRSNSKSRSLRDDKQKGQTKDKQNKPFAFKAAAYGYCVQTSKTRFGLTADQ
jgi:hypothetical protein